MGVKIQTRARTWGTRLLWLDLKNSSTTTKGAASARPTLGSRAVEIAVLIEGQVSGGLSSIGRTREAIEDAKRPVASISAGPFQSEGRTVKGIARIGRAVKIAAPIEDECPLGTVCVIIECVQDRFPPASRFRGRMGKSKYRSQSGAVKVALPIYSEACRGQPVV